MEDRITPELYLEMAHATPEEYAAERVPELVRTPGVERVTWWVNDHVPGHPRSRMPEFPLLGVCELAGAGVAPPSPPNGVTGLHFHHYPRPGQGTLAGRATLGILLVLISSATPDGAPALRDWADFNHIRHIAAASVPDFTMITPYERVGADWDGTGPRFMHFYEMETDAPQRAYEGMLQPVMDRLGGPETQEFAAWAHHDQLVIEYVNTFRRVGEALPEAADS